MTPRRRRRLRHHLACLAGAVLVMLVANGFLEGDFRTRMSTGLAYAAALWLALTLSLGTFNLMRSRPNPLSSDLRRDLGIWTALLAVSHTVVGLTVHLQGQTWLYFLAPAEQRLPGPLRLDWFGLGNYLGAVAAVLFLGLALISSDAALARFGAVRWKRWQRAAYFAAAATASHGLLYQIIEGRGVGLVAFLSCLIVLVLGAQFYGIRLTNRH